ncbi:MAG: response regulator [Rhodospirillales bacterium]|nr:response regulator [Rhodospirillales bacterium]
MSPKVLVIDDDEMALDLVEEVLAKDGWAVTKSTSTAKGLEKLQFTPYDVLLLDYYLEDGDAVSVLNKLRQIGSTVPVVVMTASDSQKVAVQCFRLGAVDFVPKPFDADFLRIVARRTYENRGPSLRDSVLRLLQFSKHRDDCGVTKGAECTCGFETAVNGAREAIEGLF